MLFYAAAVVNAFVEFANHGHNCALHDTTGSKKKAAQNLKITYKYIPFVTAIFYGGMLTAIAPLSTLPPLAKLAARVILPIALFELSDNIPTRMLEVLQIVCRLANTYFLVMWCTTPVGMAVVGVGFLFLNHLGVYNTWALSSKLHKGLAEA